MAVDFDDSTEIEFMFEDEVATISFPVVSGGGFESLPNWGRSILEIEDREIPFERVAADSAELNDMVFYCLR